MASSLQAHPNLDPRHTTQLQLQLTQEIIELERQQGLASEYRHDSSNSRVLKEMIKSRRAMLSNLPRNSFY